MSEICLDNGECRKYCTALDLLTKSKPTSECEWPERINDKHDFTSATNPELATTMATRVISMLSLANEIRTVVAQPGSEQYVAYNANATILAARMELWSAYAEASAQDRPITDVEVTYYTNKLFETSETARTEIRKQGVSPENQTHMLAVHDRETLEKHGLLFDEAMLQTVTQLAVNASSGSSTLLIGDKGIAKTQAAKFVSGLFSPDSTPQFISGDGSMMKDEFIGKMTLAEKNGATVTHFQEGILTRCMEQGIPLVLDEINLIDPAIAMRLQDVLLRKPGDTITIQEDNGRKVKVKHGFCVIATANEASTRYQSRAVLDPAFRDRFIILNVEYPDSDTVMLQMQDRPVALTRLANAFTISKDGVPNPRVPAKDAHWIASIAHASQQLYSKPAKDVQTGQLGSNVANVIDDTEPRMNDCITPRKMVRILETVADGIDPYAVQAGIKGVAIDTIAAMQRSEDRQTMFEILRLMHDGDPKKFDEATIKGQLRI